MAITRLTDIITVFDSKWTYGDVKFGYDGEVNQDHDTQYPLMLVNPPESIMPVVYDGREEYSFEINFYNLYSQAAQSVVTLQKRWDNLQDLSNEWLDMVLKKYQDVTVEAYLNDESIEIERIKDTQNDKLVQIKLTFTMSAFTKCFRPVSNYPSDFAGLAVWLRADSGVTFDIPTKGVSAWGNEVSEQTGMVQALSDRQPLRYGYGGQNDKCYFDFNGVSSDMNSVNNLPVEKDFTIFEVSHMKKEMGIVFSYEKETAYILIGIDANSNFYTRVSDGTSTLFGKNATNSTVSSHIGVLKKSGATLNMEYYDSSISIKNNNTDVAFNTDLEFNNSTFKVGRYNSELLNGDIQEIIIYNRALSSSEIDNVTGYLNLKYKIY